MYTDTVYDEMRRNDRYRDYLSGSPSYGNVLDDKELGLLRIYYQKQGGAMGDIHHYDYTSLCTDITNFPHSRFVSEYGYQSLPSIYTWEQEISPEYFDMDSQIIYHRQHIWGGGFSYLDGEIKSFFNMPTKESADNYFKKYIYISQVTQSICMSSRAEYYRREMSNPEAYTMGSLYWQLNDIWAGVTWASLEYDGRWKMLHYSVKRFYSTVLISPFDDKNDNIVMYVISDRTVKSQSNLTVEIWNWNGNLVSSESLIVDNPLHNSTQVWKKSFSETLKGKNKSEVFVNLILKDANTNELLSTNWFYPNQNYGGFKSIKLEKPTISVKDVQLTSETELQFVLTTDKPAPYTLLENPIKGVFTDNGMVVVPNREYLMKFKATTKIDLNEWQKNLKITSLYDISA